MSKSTWTGAVSSDWNDPDNWSPAGVPGVFSDVVIASRTPVALASASIGTVNSITDSSYLSFESAGTNIVVTFLDDTGHLYVDAKAGEGGTILDIGGTLTNSGYLSIGNATLSASDEVTAASLDNTGKTRIAPGASIYLTGSSANQALLDVTGSAGFGTAEVLSGYARLAGDSAIEFKGGQIIRLAPSAHLGLVGNQAFIEDSTAQGKNSALTGLASIAFGASFALRDEAAVSTTGALLNEGAISLDFNAGDGGGSSLNIGGTLTNYAYLEIGNTAISASDTVTATSLDNTAFVKLTGSSANQALLDVTTLDNENGSIKLIGSASGANRAFLNVSGATTNNGTISITNDTEELAGPVGGAGSFSLNDANLRFDSSVSAGQSVSETGADALILEQAQSFAATISGFGTGDTIDAMNFHAPPATTFNFVENSAMTGGTLTLTDTSLSLTANIPMTGVYTKSDFTLAPDSGTGTLVKFV